MAPTTTTDQSTLKPSSSRRGQLLTAALKRIRPRGDSGETQQKGPLLTLPYDILRQIFMYSTIFDQSAMDRLHEESESKTGVSDVLDSQYGYLSLFYSCKAAMRHLHDLSSIEGEKLGQQLIVANTLRFFVPTQPVVSETGTIDRIKRKLPSSSSSKHVYRSWEHLQDVTQLVFVDIEWRSNVPYEERRLISSKTAMSCYRLIAAIEDETAEAEAQAKLKTQAATSRVRAAMEVLRPNLSDNDSRHPLLPYIKAIIGRLDTRVRLSERSEQSIRTHERNLRDVKSFRGTLSQSLVFLTRELNDRQDVEYIQYDPDGLERAYTKLEAPNTRIVHQKQNMEHQSLQIDEHSGPQRWYIPSDSSDFWIRNKLTETIPEQLYLYRTKDKGPDSLTVYIPDLSSLQDGEGDTVDKEIYLRKFNNEIHKTLDDLRIRSWTASNDPRVTIDYISNAPPIVSDLSPTSAPRGPSAQSDQQIRPSGLASPTVSALGHKEAALFFRELRLGQEKANLYRS